MTTHRIDPRAGFVHAQPKGADGLPTCRECGAGCSPPRRTFCSDACVTAWKIRTMPGFVRQKLRDRDRGVCRECGVDTTQLRERVNRLLMRARRFRRPWRYACAIYRALARHRWIARMSLTDQRHAFAYRLTGTLWHADHIVAVALGGGGTGLDNYQTLCVPCHKRKTARDRRKMREART